jgi:hypothetical protein
VSYVLIGADAVSGSLRAAAAEVSAELPNKVRHFGQLLRTRVMANASGRPGPRAVTGDYRRSWVQEFKGGATSPTSIVGTSAPQGRRLEFGFHGVDSLGRHYNQPPFPHARPAFDATAPEFEAAVNDLVGKWFV